MATTVGATREPGSLESSSKHDKYALKVKNTHRLNVRYWTRAQMVQCLWASLQLRLLTSKFFLLKGWKINTANVLLTWHVWSNSVADCIHVWWGLSANPPLRVAEEVSYRNFDFWGITLWNYSRWHFCFSLHAKRTSTVPISFKSSKGSGWGGINVVSARLWNDNSLLERSGRVELGLRSLPKRPLSSFHQPYLGKTWRQPLCEWEQLSALSLHSPRSRKIQYLAYLRDQNLALWGRSHGRGTRRAQGRGAAACWPIGTPAPGCEMGYHARSGWWTEENTKQTRKKALKF